MFVILNFNKMKKIFCINSLEKRKTNLISILPNILKQCDILHINTIGYELDLGNLKINNKEKIITKKFSSLGSEGRLLYYNDYNDNDYYFTIDDDILYPENYSSRLIEAHNKNKNSVICVHGSSLLNKQNPDYRKRNVIHFSSPLSKITKVEFPGVGTSCFKKGELRIKYDDFKVKNMSDPFIGVFSKNQGISIYCVDRPKNWLKQLGEHGVRIFGNNQYNEINNLLKNR